MQIDGKNITAIASDLDGTLIFWPDVYLSDRVLSFVRKILDGGLIFVAASGRQYENVAKLFAPVKDEIYFVCENGSMVVYRDRIILLDCIEEETANELIRDIRRCLGNINTIVSSEGGVYGEACNADFISFVNEKRAQCFKLVDDFSMIKAPKNKISVVFPDGNADHGDMLRQKYSDRLSVVDAGGGWLDFTSKTANKGSGLRFLKENVLGKDTAFACFGDSENDISMFPESAVSFAMSHSSTDVRSRADHGCSDVVELLSGLMG